MEIEKNQQLIFGGVLVDREEDNSLGYTFYKKKTHTTLMLNAKSHQYRAQLQTVT